jgi:hypothetical protein
MTFHPLVTRFLARRPHGSAGAKAEHYRLESTLDCILCEHFGTVLTDARLRRSTHAARDEGCRLVRFFARGLTAACSWSERDLYYALRRAFCKQIWLNRLFHTRAFFSWSRVLSQCLPMHLQVFHALAYPPLPARSRKAAMDPSWAWAVRCWRTVPIPQRVEEAFFRCEDMARVAFAYEQRHISPKAALEGFMDITPSTGLTGQAPRTEHSASVEEGTTLGFDKKASIY